MAFQSFRYALMGQTEQAVSAALAARSIKEQMQLTDEWNVAAPMILPTAYSWLEDYPAVEREAAEALATPELTEPVKLVMMPGVLALAWFESGRLNRAADTPAPPMRRPGACSCCGTRSPCCAAPVTGAG